LIKNTITLIKRIGREKNTPVQKISKRDKLREIEKRRNIGIGRGIFCMRKKLMIIVIVPLPFIFK
jgi:hypothetical protein